MFWMYAFYAAMLAMSLALMFADPKGKSKDVDGE